MLIFHRTKAGCSGSSRPRSPKDNGSPQREQVNRGERQQKIRNKDGRSSIILCHPLSEEQRENRDGGNYCAIKCNRRTPRENYHHASNRAQRSGGDLKDSDRGHHRGHNSRQGTFSEMSLQPFQVAPPIHNFINARLKEKNSEKCRDQRLQETDCTIERVDGWHATTLILNNSPLSILHLARAKKQGRGFYPRPCFVELSYASYGPTTA